MIGDSGDRQYIIITPMLDFKSMELPSELIPWNDAIYFSYKKRRLYKVGNHNIRSIKR
jgi:hypothetical protein